MRLKTENSSFLKQRKTGEGEKSDACCEGLWEKDSDEVR